MGEAFIILLRILTMWNVGLAQDWEVIEAIRSVERLTRAADVAKMKAQVEVSA